MALKGGLKTKVLNGVQRVSAAEPAWSPQEQRLLTNPTNSPQPLGAAPAVAASPRPRPAPAHAARGAEGGRAGPGRERLVRSARVGPAAVAAPSRDVAAPGRAPARLRGRHGRAVAAVGAAERGADAQVGVGAGAARVSLPSPGAARVSLPSQGAAVPGGPGRAAGSGRGAAGLRAAAPGRGAGPVLRRVPVQAEFRHPRLQPPGTGRAGRGEGPGTHGSGSRSQRDPTGPAPGQE